MVASSRAQRESGSERSKLGQVAIPVWIASCLPGGGDLEAWAEDKLASEVPRVRKQVSVASGLGVEREGQSYTSTTSTSVGDVGRPRRKAQGGVCTGRSSQRISVCSLPTSWGRVLPTLSPQGRNPSSVQI